MPKPYQDGRDVEQGLRARLESVEAALRKAITLTCGVSKAPADVCRCPFCSELRAVLGAASEREKP